MISHIMRYGVTLSLLLPVFTSAQVSSFFVNSRYGGTYAARVNPATSAQMQHKWVVSPGGFDFSIFNNYLSMSMPYHPYRLALKNYPDSLTTRYDNPLWRWNWVQTSKSDQNISLHGFIRINGPSALVKLGSHSFGLLSEVNFYADLKGIPKPLADAFYEDLRRGHKLRRQDSNFLNNGQQIHLNIKQQGWAAIGFHYAYLWKFKRRKMISAGITYKLLHGMGGSQIQVDAGNIEEQPDRSIRISSPGFEIKTLMPRKNLFYPKGFGGIDLGVQFLNKKSETGKHNNSKYIHPEYMYRIGLSLLDIGRLVYTRTITTFLKSESEAMKMPSIEEVLTWSPDKIKDELTKNFANLRDVEPQTVYGKTTRIGLPTRLVLHGDMQVTKMFYLDFLLQQNLRRVSSRHIHTLSFLSVTPRFEKRNWTVGFPISLDNNYRQFRMGFYARWMYLYFGSRHIAAVVHPNGKQGADLFIGIQFGNLPGKFLKIKTPYLFLKKRRCAEF